MRLTILACTILVLFSCERVRYYTAPDARVGFSEDTVFFDTVFTTIGTTTQQLRVYNDYDQALEVSSIHLAGGEASVFRLNIDGIEGNQASDIEIPPNDSIYIFIEATLDPNGLDSLLVIRDSIIFNTNGFVQDVDLMAWGQDVHLIREDTLQSTTWINDKPYLVYRSVWVDSNAVLTINPGVRVHFHKQATMIVKGSLKVNGTIDEPVTFQGDRLEELYQDVPGQWNGVYFWPGVSRENVIDYLVIKNGIFGLWADSLATHDSPTISISNSIIRNMSSVGLFGRGTSIRADNCVISDCGQYALALLIGGSYEFYHCTIANYWSGFSNRTTPALVMNNYYEDVNGNIQIREIDRAYFANCIIYGNRENELEIDKHPDGKLGYKFEYCLTRISNDMQQEDTVLYDLNDDTRYLRVINNEDPGFVLPDEFDYQLDTLSPAQDAASPGIAVSFPVDILGNDRLSDDGPDIGAYERVLADSIRVF